MKCSKCNWYSLQLRRGKKGAINPPTIKGGVDLDVARWMVIKRLLEENSQEEESKDD